MVLARKHDMKTRDIKETERFICYVLDNASALAEKHPEGGGQIQVLFDLSGEWKGVGKGCGYVWFCYMLLWRVTKKCVQEDGLKGVYARNTYEKS